MNMWISINEDIKATERRLHVQRDNRRLFVGKLLLENNFSVTLYLNVESLIRFHIKSPERSSLSCKNLMIGGVDVKKKVRIIYT